MLLRIAKIFRFLFFFAIAAAVVIPTVLYLVVSSKWGQDKLRTIGQEELGKALGTEVKIGNLALLLPNSIVIDDVAVADDNDSTALTINKIDARFELWDFLFSKKIIIDYASVEKLHLRLYRATPDSPLNVEQTIKRLAKKDDDKEPAKFKLRLNDVTFEDCSASYDVLSRPVTPEKFNSDHIAISDLSLVAFVPVINNSDYHVLLRELSLREHSGLYVKSLSTDVEINDKQLSIANFKCSLEESLLLLGDISIPLNGINDIANIAKGSPVDVRILKGSHIWLPELQCFVPEFAKLNYDLAVDLDVSADKDTGEIRALNISDTNGWIKLTATGKIANISNTRELRLSDVDFDITTHPKTTSLVLAHLPADTSPILRNIIENLGVAHARGRADAEMHEGKVGSADVKASLKSAIAALDISGQYSTRGTHSGFSAEATIDSLKLGLILNNPDLNQLAGRINASGGIEHRRISARANADISKFDFKGHRYRSISASGEYSPESMALIAGVNDPCAGIDVDLSTSAAAEGYDTRAEISIDRLDLDSLNIARIGQKITADISLNGIGKSLKKFMADLCIRNLKLQNREGEVLDAGTLTAVADNMADNNHIDIHSKYLDATLNGSYDLTTLVPTVKGMYYKIMPALAPAGYKAPGKEAEKEAVNQFMYSLDFKKPDEICEYFHLPVSVLEKANMIGKIDQDQQLSYLKIDIPWIQQGDKLIENTSMSMNLDAVYGKAILYATSLMPTKKGDMDLATTISSSDGTLDAMIDWKINRAIPINGKIHFLTRPYRNTDDRLCARVDFDKSQINFGDEIWNLNNSTINYDGSALAVSNFNLSTLTQNIYINGVAGPDTSDILLVKLSEIKLIEIFETLEIDKALISGYATGTITASALLSKNPQIETREFKVRDIGYNYCTLGNADVRLGIKDEGRLFVFDADVVEPGGEKSYLEGSINIPKEELDLNINARHIKVGFMKPFMEAFTSDVSGYASGRAHLYGTFKDMDLTGDIQADSLRMKIDFTNTWYSASDSIHIRPGRINLDNITLYDDYGNSALLNGWVSHKYFHEAAFDFNITHAYNFLCYDETEKNNPDWYGRIFGNGWARVTGKPGVVDINVNMATAKNSVFTFVLSDQEVADEFSFISFRDATPVSGTEIQTTVETVPEKVTILKTKTGNNTAEEPTAYNMDIAIDINDKAQLIIVMDPIGGDRIKAEGSGNMRMTYRSVDNDLKLYGRYTLDHGSYNFTLQDIIIKDFTIKKNSSITFNGDPYSAQLNITAYYQVNANLSDLDESFLQDKELNRTNVPVRAIMNLTGDMRQPDINFDLEFPTLSSDIYRKVRSIVSTDDMMNRQIIYLLALNRFYTPEYMASTTKGNELFSVASSTISSQLSSMLGKLSDNWSIAPNLRSDRGDFSDLEVDLTLTSSLLNNRLLFNGNFGYRDKTLNTNQFVGDFDLEYLLNRSGTWRFKAYNRYNDQNYYLRTAQTTQGIGIVFRRDFDSIRSFFHSDNDKTSPSDTLPGLKPDTPPQLPEAPDTIIIEEKINITDNLITSPAQ